MRLTARAAEVAHIAAVIDQPYESAKHAARAVIKATAEALDFREWYVIEDGGLLWGLFGSEKEAEKALVKLQGQSVMQDARILPVTTVARMLARTNGIPLDEDCSCGHPGAEHLFEGSSRGACGWSTCDCKKFKKSDHPLPAHPTCVTCRQPVLA